MPLWSLSENSARLGQSPENMKCGMYQSYARRNSVKRLNAIRFLWSTCIRPGGLEVAWRSSFRQRMSTSSMLHCTITSSFRYKYTSLHYTILMQRRLQKQIRHYRGQIRFLLHKTSVFWGAHLAYFFFPQWRVLPFIFNASTASAKTVPFHEHEYFR